MATIIQGYGMTETSGPICAGVLGSDELGSVGIPLPGNEVKIIDRDTKEEVPYGEVGEIVCSGPVVMAGYLDNEKETNEILELDKKGKVWVHTGDMGYMTEKGVVYYVQRLKRMLIVSGYNVYPTHLENTIVKHDAVKQCGVIGVPHPYKVQVPIAYVILNEKYENNLDTINSIKKYCEDNLAKYMMPKKIIVVTEFPKTLVGKIDYKELEKKYNGEN